jgi:hypothetical protein
MLPEPNQDPKPDGGQKGNGEPQDPKPENPKPDDPKPHSILPKPSKPYQENFEINPLKDVIDLENSPSKDSTTQA